MRKSVTLSDVAKAAAVSLGTASNAFSRPDKVRPEVRARVESAARDLGYSGPDPKARLLMGGRVNAIGVIAPVSIATCFNDVYLRAFMSGAAEVCDELGAALVTISATNEEAAGRGVKNALVDGFILHNSQHMAKLVEMARARGLPFVAVDSEPDPDVNSINVDSRGGARQAAQHLLNLGHFRIAILSMLTISGGRHPVPIYHAPLHAPHQLVETFVDTRDRFQGYAEALSGIGMSINRVPIVEADLDPQNAAEGARLLLDTARDATAVLAMSDGLALAVLDGARHRGIAVPRDLSVVGFDDVAEAATADPPLTTIAQPIRDKGRAAARAILEPPLSPRHEVLPVKLVVRASTAPPPD
jgi:DNA-binding LacI/PurR family transcriptional regulator